MAAQTLSTFATMLKEHWLPPMVKEFNLSTVLLDKLRRRSVKPVGGEYYLYPIHTGRNEAVGTRAEGAILPSPDKQTYNQAKLNRFALYGKFLISGWVLDAAKGDDTAVDALDSEMRNLRMQMSDDLNRLLYGIGSGKFANVVSLATSTLTLDSTRYLRGGQTCVLASRDGTADAEAITIVTVDSTTVVTVAETPNTDTEESVYGPGITSNLSLCHNEAFHGLDGIIDTGNPDAIDNDRHGTGTDYADDNLDDYGFIDRGSVDSWKGNVLSNGSVLRNLDIELMMQALHEAEIDGGRPTLALMNHELWRRYGLIMAGNKTWQNNIQRMDGGWAYLDFVGIPCVADKHCPDHTMFFLDMSTFDLLIERELGFMDGDGNVMVRVGTGTSSKDQYEGTMIWRGALGCNKPNASSKIEDLAHTLV